MTTAQRHRRHAIWNGFASAILFYGLILILPAVGGMITN